MDNVVESFAIGAEKILHVNQIEEKFPSATPTISKFTAALTVGDEDQVSVAPWYDSVHYLKEFPTELEETGWIFETDSNGEKIIKAFEYVIQKLDEYAKQGLYPISHGIYARYFRGTNGGLSMSAHRDNMHVCGFDMASGKDLPGYAIFRQDMQAFLVGELHARPHWGKFAPDDIDYSALYGKEYEKFQQALQKWYSDNELDLEKSMLLNNFHARILGLLPAQRLDEKKSSIFFSTDKDIKNRDKISPSKQDDTNTKRSHYSVGCLLQ